MRLTRIKESGINKPEFDTIELYLNYETNKQLYKINEMVDKEIRLSETAIKEGFEKRC